MNARVPFSFWRCILENAPKQCIRSFAAFGIALMIQYYYAAPGLSLRDAADQATWPAVIVMNVLLAFSVLWEMAGEWKLAAERQSL